MEVPIFRKLLLAKLFPADSDLGLLALRLFAVARC
jgi:hypothetical protein